MKYVLLYLCWLSFVINLTDASSMYIALFFISWDICTFPFVMCLETSTFPFSLAVNSHCCIPTWAHSGHLTRGSMAGIVYGATNSDICVRNNSPSGNLQENKNWNSVYVWTQRETPDGFYFHLLGSSVASLAKKLSRWKQYGVTWWLNISESDHIQ